MRILKAYTDVGTGGNYLGTDSGAIQKNEKNVLNKYSSARKSGDSITLSSEARNALGRDAVSPSLNHHDATYDKFGNVTRQFENLRQDLRTLTSQFLTTPGVASMAPQLANLQGRLNGLEAIV